MDRFSYGTFFFVFIDCFLIPRRVSEGKKFADVPGSDVQANQILESGYVVDQNS